MQAGAHDRRAFIFSRIGFGRGWVRVLVLGAIVQFTNAQVLDWVQSYPIGHGSHINVALEMPGGGYLLVGHSFFSADSGNFQGIVIRTDDNGQMLWWRMYGGTTDDLFKCAAMIGNEIWIGGTFDSTGSGWFVSTLWRLSTDGDSLWARSYLSFPYLEKVRAAPGGGVFTTTSGGPMLARINPEGNVDWVIDGPSEHGRVRAIENLPDGSLVVSCQVLLSDTLAIAVYWVQPDGQVTDTAIHRPPPWWGGMPEAGPEALAAISLDEVIVAGWRKVGPSFFEESPYLFRISRTGETAWHTTITEEFARHAVGVHIIHDSASVVTWKPFTEAGWGNPVLNLYDLDGNFSHYLVLDITPGGSGYVFVSATQDAASNRVLVVGSRDLPYDSLTTQGFLAQVSFDPTGVERSIATVADHIELSLSPNPFNSRTTLSLYVPNESRVEVVLYDVLGRVIETIADEVFSPGTHHVMIDGRRLASGIYFVRAKAGTQEMTRQVLLLK